MDHDDGFGWPDDADGPTDDVGGDPSGLDDGYPDFAAPDDPPSDDLPDGDLPGDLPGDDAPPDDQPLDGYPRGDVPSDSPDEFAAPDGDGLHDDAHDSPDATHPDHTTGDAPGDAPGDTPDDSADGAPHDGGSHDSGSDDASDEHPGDEPVDDGALDSFGAGLDTAGDHDATWHPDEFPPELDLGADAPEPLDGYPWSDPQLLGSPGPADLHDVAGAGVGPADPDDLLAYAGLDGGGDNPWSALLASDDPATSALARWWGPTG